VLGGNILPGRFGTAVGGDQVLFNLRFFRDTALVCDRHGQWRTLVSRASVHFCKVQSTGLSVGRGRAVFFCPRRNRSRRRAVRAAFAHAGLLPIHLRRGYNVTNSSDLPRGGGTASAGGAADTRAEGQGHNLSERHISIFEKGGKGDIN